MSPPGRMTVLLLKDLFVIFTVTGGALVKQFLTAGTARRRGERFTDMNHRNKGEETLIRERLRNFSCVRVCGREKARRFRCHVGPPTPPPPQPTRLNDECIFQIRPQNTHVLLGRYWCALICPSSTRVVCSGCDGLTSSREHVTCHRPGRSFCSAS